MLKTFLKFILSKITVFRTAPKFTETYKYTTYPGICPECGAEFFGKVIGKNHCNKFDAGIGVCYECKRPMHLILNAQKEIFETEKWEVYVRANS
jgi:hypothetical protein